MTPPGHPSDGVEPRRNFLLRALPAEEYALLVAAAEPIEAGMRQVAYQPGEPIEHAYFPLQAVYSLVALADNGTAAVEVSTIGREGMLGLPAFLGAPSSPNLAFCQVPGSGLRVPAEVVSAALATGGTLSALLAHYTQATLVQLAQNVACNRLHRIDQQCARWLLLTQDRVDRDQFPLTHELLAQMLGVRRATVSVSAARLQAAGLIRYTHGVITVADRAGLEAAACDCYTLVRREFDALLPPRRQELTVRPVQLIEPPTPGPERADRHHPRLTIKGWRRVAVDLQARRGQEPTASVAVRSGLPSTPRSAPSGCPKPVVLIGWYRVWSAGSARWCGTGIHGCLGQAEACRRRKMSSPRSAVHSHPAARQDPLRLRRN